MKAAVLTYHSHNISGAEYGRNDHVALAIDLEALRAADARFTSLAEIAKAVTQGRIDDEGPLHVGLSFDDGPVFDYRDFEHPRFGPQRGFAGVMQDFHAAHPDAPPPRATSFVIASPDARNAMERAPDCGYPFLRDWLADDWWQEAASGPWIDIGNHSWDHVHHAPDHVALSRDVRDDFTAVTTYPDADGQVRRAASFINAKIGGRCTLFAYPFGHVSDYLAKDYLPHRSGEHGMQAAFGVAAGRVPSGCSRWIIPRMVCGHHWHHTDELLALLEAR
jgi:hypothetical protein